MTLEVYKMLDEPSGAHAIKINELATLNVNNIENDGLWCKLFHSFLIRDKLLKCCNIRKNGAGYKVRTRDPLITNCL